MGPRLSGVKNTSSLQACTADRSVNGGKGVRFDVFNDAQAKCFASSRNQAISIKR